MQRRGFTSESVNGRYRPACYHFVWRTNDVLTKAHYNKIRHKNTFWTCSTITRDSKPRRNNKLNCTCNARRSVPCRVKGSIDGRKFANFERRRRSLGNFGPVSETNPGLLPRGREYIAVVSGRTAYKV